MKTNQAIISGISPNSKFFDSYTDIKTNPSKYASFINVHNALIALQDADKAQNNELETNNVQKNVVKQIDSIFIPKGLKGLGTEYSLTSDNEIDNIASAAIFVNTGVLIPPGALKYQAEIIYTYIADRKRVIDEATQFNSNVDGADMPNGIIYFWKYFKGQPRNGQPIIKEVCKIGYFKNTWRPATENEAKGKLSFAEMEGLFLLYFPLLRNEIDYNNIPNRGKLGFWEMVLKIEAIRKNPPAPPAPLTSGSFDWVGGQANGRTAFHVTGGGHGLTAGQKVKITTPDAYYNGIHVIDYVGDDSGANKQSLFTIALQKSGNASGTYELYNPNGNGGNQNTDTNTGAKTNYTPFIIGGAVLVGGGLLYAIFKKKSK